MFLIFLSKSTLTIRDINIIRLQIPMTPGFAIKDYKVQETIFQIAVLDLQSKSNSGNKNMYKRFYSIYI